MIDHASIAVSDYEKSKELYQKMLAPVGYMLTMDLHEYKVAGFGEGGRSDFWIGQKASAGGGHIAFAARDQASVEAFYRAGLEAGGTDNGAPGYRKEYSAGYFAAFVHDYDNNNVEVVWHDPNPPAA